jgi:hypothetical protein
MPNILNMTNKLWWKGLPKEIECDLEILSELKDIN